MRLLLVSIFTIFIFVSCSNKVEKSKINHNISGKSIKEKRKLVEFYKTSNPSYALKILEELVALEDIESMKKYASANIYMIRPVQEQNFHKALKTYERLDELGDLSSTMNLGNFYEYAYHKGLVKKDKNKSLFYYEKAASKGYIPAVKKLIKIYSCKKCKPNRYNEKRAKELKDKFILKE